MSAAVVQKAGEAAPYCHGLLIALLAVSSDFTTPEQKRRYAAKAFQCFASLRDRMDDLGAIATNSKAEGEAEAASLREIAGGAR